MTISRHVCADKKMIFLMRSQNISSHVCGDPNRYFTLTLTFDIFLTLTKWVLWLNLTRPYILRGQSIKLKT